MMRVVARMAWAVLSLVALPSLAETTIQNPADLVKNLRQHITEFQQMLQSDDPAVRAAAAEIALSDSSPSVRGMAMAVSLSRFSALTPEFILEGTSGPELRDLPNIAIVEMRWKPDGRSFQGSLNCRNQVGGPFI